MGSLPKVRDIKVGKTELFRFEEGGFIKFILLNGGLKVNQLFNFPDEELINFAPLNDLLPAVPPSEGISNDEKPLVVADFYSSFNLFIGEGIGLFFL